jgi:type I restriction enzyme S subunit
MYDTEEKITQLGIEKSNAKIHPACSVAIALSGRGQTRGRTTVLKEPMACSQSVAIMILNSELKPEYLHYNLSNRYMEIRNLTGNLDRSGLNLSIVSDIQIPVPSIAEQEEIALVLITVDKRIELEKEEKMRLGHIRQGLMDLLLNGKIRIKVD